MPKRAPELVSIAPASAVTLKVARALFVLVLEMVGANVLLRINTLNLYC